MFAEKIYFVKWRSQKFGLGGGRGVQLSFFFSWKVPIILNFLNKMVSARGGGVGCSKIFFYECKIFFNELYQMQKKRTSEL